jgi:hypothetical protein
MKYILLFTIIICSTINTFGQQTKVTFDPQRDTIAQRISDGTIQIRTSTNDIRKSLETSLGDLTDFRAIQIKKIGLSQYLTFKATQKQDPLVQTSGAILLVETSPGIFQADQLLLTCSGSCGDCGEEPNKSCGCCGQSRNTELIMAKVISPQH